MDRRLWPALMRPVAWAALAACAAPLAGCAATTPTAGDSEAHADMTEETSPEATATDDAPSPPPLASPGPEDLWDDGSLAVTTPSGVHLAVPADWTETAGDALGDAEEAVLRWEDGTERYGEIGVINAGASDDGPADAVADYLDFLSNGSEDSPDIDILDEPAEAEIPGATDAMRVDYAYPIPGGGGAEAHGRILGFTATTGDILLVVVSGDGEHATEDLSEEILDTVRVEEPADLDV